MTTEDGSMILITVLAMFGTGASFGHTLGGAFSTRRRGEVVIASWNAGLGPHPIA